MRTLTITFKGLLVLLLLVLAGTAQAADCRWKQETAASLYKRGSTAAFSRHFICPAQARGEVEVEMRALSSGTQLDQSSKQLEPEGKWQRMKRLSVDAYPSSYCEGEPPEDTRKLLRRSNGRESAHYIVPIQVQVRGTGDLVALNSRYEMDVYCSLCRRSSIGHRFGFFTGQWDEETRLSGRLPADWYECARFESTLNMRFFAGATEGEVRQAIVPIYVLEGLEDQWVQDGDNYRLDVEAPHAALCEHQQASGEKQVYAWEVHGRGKLMAIGGLGRSLFRLNCPEAEAGN